MPTYERLDYGSPDGSQWGGATSDKVALYGTTPVTQRAGAAQNTTALSTASSTAIDTATKAAIIEIMDTLRVLGLWKGAA